MQKGTVMKAYSSYYYVQNEKGLTQCKLRGRLKKERFQLYVGDQVQFCTTMLSQGDSLAQGVIEEILPRQSLLKRPPIANIDRVVLVFAAKNPDFNAALLDRFLILTESSHLETFICINKIDLLNDCEVSVLEKKLTLYRAIGYQVFSTSTNQNLGLLSLKSALTHGITVFAGPSGVGKSSLLNQIQPGFQLKTGEVSEKIGRGKHTTRFAELLPLPTGGFIVDTPGFSHTELTDIPLADLAKNFPEFRSTAKECRFTTCLHDQEPNCAIKAALQTGQITQERYNSYCKALTEIKSAKKGSL